MATHLSNGPLDGHRAEDGPDETHPRVGLEGTVDEQPVEADRDAQRRQDVHAEQQAQVGPVETPTPQKNGAAITPSNGTTMAKSVTKRTKKEARLCATRGGNSAAGSATGNTVISGTTKLHFGHDDNNYEAPKNGLQRQIRLDAITRKS